VLTRRARQEIDPPFGSGRGPAGIPEAIIRKLDAAIAKAMTDPSFLDTLGKFVLTPVFRGTEDFRKLAA
jgi:tripartite-type tricarboxylate transporter receptor subunit TctC